MSIDDPILSKPPSDDELAHRLTIAVDGLDRDTAYTIVMALQGLGPDDRGRHSDAFRRQLCYSFRIVLNFDFNE